MDLEFDDAFQCLLGAVAYIAPATQVEIEPARTYRASTITIWNRYQKIYTRFEVRHIRQAYSFQYNGKWQTYFQL